MGAAMLVSVWVTAASMEEAEEVARHVLGKRLAACANAWPLRSWYWWQGTLEQAEEVGLLLKARQEDLPALEQAVKEVHSYDVPCVVGWPIAAGSAPYLDWVRAETAAAKRKA
jgi:periplasmic divalent cation tolerance protein